MLSQTRKNYFTKLFQIHKTEYHVVSTLTPCKHFFVTTTGSLYANQNAAAAMSALQISSSAAAAAAGAPAMMAPGISSLATLSR